MLPIFGFEPEARAVRLADLNGRDRLPFLAADTVPDGSATAHIDHLVWLGHVRIDKLALQLPVDHQPCGVLQAAVRPDAAPFLFPGFRRTWIRAGDPGPVPVDGQRLAGFAAGVIPGGMGVECDRFAPRLVARHQVHRVTGTRLFDGVQDGAERRRLTAVLRVIACLRDVVVRRGQLQGDARQHEDRRQREACAAQASYK